jgi:predicted transposase YbfD/YdcC
MGSFFEHFASLPDPRIDRTKRHKLCDIIFIAIAAVLSGCDDWNEMEQYGKAKYDWLKNYLELPNGIPSHDTFNRLFAALDPKAFQQCFISWVQSACQLTEGSLVSIDGKRLRSSGVDGSSSIVHLVSLWSEANQMMLAQCKVADKSNEITAIPTLLKALELKGCIVSIDAMGCQREIAASIVDKGADYILSVKENQPFLHDDVQEAFAQSRKGTSHHTELDMGHGRIEKRSCRILADAPQWICRSEKWKGVQTLVEITSQRRDKKTEEQQKEVRYYISSLASGDAAWFNSLVRSHWSIENSLHWTLDVVFSEDQSRKRAGNAAENFALLTRIALNVLKNDKSVILSMKIKRHKAGWDNDYLLHLLTSIKI